MHLLLGKGCLTPAEVTDAIGTMGKGFQGPKANHARGGARVTIGPVYRPRLLFHDPEATVQQPAGLIMVVGGKVRMPGAHIGH